jgi:hypothetical protein
LTIAKFSVFFADGQSVKSNNSSQQMQQPQQPQQPQQFRGMVCGALSHFVGGDRLRHRFAVGRDATISASVRVC